MVRSIVVVTLWIGPVGSGALALGSRRWGWVRGIDVGFEMLGSRRWRWVQGVRVRRGTRVSSNSRWSSSIWSIRMPVVGWSALSTPRFTLCTEEGVRCVWDKGGQRGGKGEINSHVPP